MPSEFWRMHPEELWLFLDAKMPEEKARHNSATKEEWLELAKLLD